MLNYKFNRLSNIFNIFQKVDLLQNNSHFIIYQLEGHAMFYPY